MRQREIARGVRSLMVLAAILVAVSVASACAGPKSFTANTTVQVKVLPFIGPCGSPFCKPDMSTEAKVARSMAVAELVQRDIDGSASATQLLEGLEIRTEQEGGRLHFEYTDPDPARAKQLSEAFAHAYIVNRNSSAEAMAEKESQPIRDELRSLKNEIPKLEVKISHLDSRSPGWSRFNAKLSVAYARQSYLMQQMIPFDAFVPDLAEIVQETAGSTAPPLFTTGTDLVPADLMKYASPECPLDNIELEAVTSGENYRILEPHRAEQLPSEALDGKNVYAIFFSGRCRGEGGFPGERITFRVARTEVTEDGFVIVSQETQSWPDDLSLSEDAFGATWDN